MLAVAIAAVIDLESMISSASMDSIVPVDDATISIAAIFSAVPSTINTDSAVLTLK